MYSRFNTIATGKFSTWKYKILHSVSGKRRERAYGVPVPFRSHLIFGIVKVVFERLTQDFPLLSTPC